MPEKSGGRNPPEPVEHESELSPTSPLSVCDTCLKPLICLGTYHGQFIYGHATMDECRRNVIGQLLAKLNDIPCMSEECDGIDDGEPATKKHPAITRCHRCTAVRLARSILST